MLSGFVFCDADTKKVLCYTEDRSGVEFIDMANKCSLNRAICLGDLTEMKNIEERFKKADLIDELSIVNVGSLYKKFF
tara:strand:- start:35 stop:268 length:234 start_codon:yes stop_codon:yes gene_type:complete